MRHRRSTFHVIALGALALVTAIGILFSPGNMALAQFGGGGGGFGGGGSGGGGFGSGGGTTGTQGSSGVVVDADGVLRMKTVSDPTGQLLRQRAEQAFASLDREVAQKSDLRKVSLTRLERVLKKRLAAGDRPNDAMLALAGLTRIEYVFCYPETGDIVLAGPAEPWGRAPSGRMQGIITGRPVVELADLAVALRCFPPSGKKTSLVYCSIDPTQEGLAQMQQFLQETGRTFQRGQERAVAQYIKENLPKSLGPQEVTIGGVSPKTHFAQVLVEADYRMKLIGIGLERPPIKMVSYVDRANATSVSRNALQRWFFVPNYECIRASDNDLAMQIVGDGVKLVGENEVVGNDGTRSAATLTNRASQIFVDGFTRKYPKLAQVSPVYAQLRNCVDMLVAAAFIQKHDYYGQAGWGMEVLGDEGHFSVESQNAPKQVAAAINAMMKGGRLMTPIGGGVQIHPALALDSQNLLDDADGAVGHARDQLDLKSLAEDQWWWD